MTASTEPRGPLPLLLADERETTWPLTSENTPDRVSRGATQSATRSAQPLGRARRSVILLSGDHTKHRTRAAGPFSNARQEGSRSARPPGASTRVVVVNSALSPITTTPEELVPAANDRLAAFYGLHAPAAVRLAYMLTGDRDVAQDLAQDAFVRIGGKVLALRDPDHARAYLFRTVINLGRGRGRKLQRERRAMRRLQPSSSTEPAPTSGDDDEIWAASGRHCSSFRSDSESLSSSATTRMYLSRRLPTRSIAR
jgi:DNA-directed RNA polymerase specialized sigma24 family protein